MAQDKATGMRIELSVDATKVKEGLDQTAKDLKKAQNELTQTNKMMKFDTNPIDAYNKKIEAINKVLPLMNTQIQKQTNFIMELEKSRDATTDEKEIARYNKEIEKQTNNLQKMKNQYEELQGQLGYATNKMKDFAEASEKASQEKIAKNISNIGSALKSVSWAVVGSLTAVSAVALKTADTLTTMNETANEAGVGVEKYQRLTYAFEKLGVKAEFLKQALSKTNSAIAKIGSGNTDTIETFNKLGISISKVSAMSNDEAFNSIIDSVGKLSSKTERLSALQKIFGDEMATKLLPIIEAGSDTLKQYGSEAEVVSEIQVKSAQETKLLQAQLKNTALTISAQLLPIVNQVMALIKKGLDKITPLITSFMTKLQNLDEPAKKMLTFITILTASASPLFEIGTKIAKLLPLISKGLMVLSAHPIIAVIVAIGAVLVAMYTKSEQFRKSVDNLVKSTLTPLSRILENIMKRLEPLFDTLGSLLQSLGDMLAPFIDIYGQVLEARLDAVADKLDFIFTILKPFLDILKALMDALNYLTDKISSKVMDKLAKVQEFLKGMMSDALENFQKFWENLPKLIEQAVNAIGDFFQKVFDWFANLFHDIGNGWSSMLNWFNGKGWVSDEELAQQASESNGYSSTANANRGSGNTQNDNRSYNINIETSADHMSIDELDYELGKAY